MRRFYNESSSSRSFRIGCSKITLLKLLLIFTLLALASIEGDGQGLLDDDDHHQKDTSLTSTTRPTTANSKRDQADQLKTGRLTSSDQNAKARGRKAPGNKKIKDIPTTDCFTRRNEILRRQEGSSGHQHANQPARHQSGTTSVAFQRLKPNHESHSALTSMQTSNSETQISSNYDGEHVPKCNHHGGYDLIQCHKIGYCWCVNKYGQAIKNSAFKPGEMPNCDASLYESESNDSVVVAGVSPHGKDYLSNVGQFESTTANGNVDFEVKETTSEQYEPNTQLTATQVQIQQKNRGPLLPLVPNDCGGSRANARERADKLSSESIWVPDCDSENANLYAEKQCHRSKVCWCVDQSTGLPLRTHELLQPRSMETNCTELKKLLELTLQPKPKDVFYINTSEHCDSDKRVEFVSMMNDQFRYQINEYIRQNPTSLNQLPPDIPTADPFAITPVQVSKWKFSIMDQDKDGKLNDREWSKFKNNFKLVERADELDSRYKQKNPFYSFAPLLLLRSQRKCWRDFLIFCERGDENVTIDLNEWLGCTDVPSKQGDNVSRKRTGGGSVVYRENPYVHSHEAAMNRTKYKNPFTGLLKPD